MGATQQFSVTATYSNGTTGTLTTGVTWSSSSTTVATVNASGLATAVAPGTATITAAANGLTATAALTVQKALKSIAVTPQNATFVAGSTQQFTATATYSDGSTANVTSSATWASSNTSVATIDSGGLATGMASGSTTISASVDQISGSAPATVTLPQAAGVNITTWHVDTNRSGVNSNEQTLTPSNVTPASFGKLFSYAVDGYVYGSPLIMSNVKINGATHNVVYVATEHDSVYAFDADNYGTGAPLWQVSLLQTGETPITDGPIQPYEGVTSTPVIDPSTNTLYVVSAQTSASTGGTFRLNALDITTGAQKFGAPVTLNVSVPATNSASVNGVQTLDTSCIQRAALLLANGNIYMGFGGCHSGWLVAYNASTLQQVGVFNSSTKLNGEGTYASAGGVWMGGGGPVADSQGNIYITTGNGPWDGQTAFADSVLKFGPTPVAGANGTMQPIDYFTPSIYQYMDCDDADLASGGLLLIPGTTTLVAGGKTGTMYLVNSTNMGHESANDAGAIQEQVWGAGLAGGNTYPDSCQDSTGNNTASITSYEIFGTSAYFNNYTYLGVTPTSSNAPGGIRQFEYSSTLTPFDDTSEFQQQGARGTSPFISANGTGYGIVWMIDQGNPLQNSNQATPTSATLRAYDAANFPTEIYNSNANPGDAPGYGIKFSSPVVANGKVYISTGHDLTTAANPQGEIDVYGLK
ncbi:MAG TPA: Ig-like domain-containing protein [Terracidiphilus sp.]|nr:Ig-like domain-containing protein [Terracidiphilus sp.]